MPREHTQALSGITHRVIAVIPVFCGLAQAALVTSIDFGGLGPGTTRIQGNTSAGSDNAAYYSRVSEPTGNWGNEVVYQFTIAETLVASLSSNAMVGDADVFLLSGLSTAPVGPKTAAMDGIGVAYLDDGPGIRETGGVIGPGTYYLSVDAWNGPDGAVVRADAGFDFGFSLSAPRSMGILGDDATAITIDSLGSSFDTELALFDSIGRLLAANDDVSVGGGVEQSELAAGVLDAGDYYVALGGWDSSFGDSFSAVGGAASGSYQLNHPNGTIMGASAGGELEWFSFTIVPEPEVLALLALSGVALLFRRR